mmetsp:Transcript_33042/g.43496  ORF Transcript_33042/g.43496 Transcript_33042/m.43496 type:complete len:258 (-) Transcript_33042:341-1114(-)
MLLNQLLCLLDHCPQHCPNYHKMKALSFCVSTKFVFSYLILGLVASLFPRECLAEEEAVTCGSVITLKHQQSKYYLHSHGINWGSGSGQQSVTAHESADNHENLWVVASAHGEVPCEVGEPIKCNSVVRLTHHTTNRNLHSHLFSSPLSKQQEVSAFGERTEGDSGDNWTVVCESKYQYWNREKPIRFKHKDTGKYLQTQESAMFNQQNCRNCPIIGQQEVYCYGKANQQNLWYTDEGVYFPAKMGGSDDDYEFDEL